MSGTTYRPVELTPLFSTASVDWLKTRTGIAPATEKSYRLAISQLTKDFGKQLLSDISGEDISAFQACRKREQVSNRTVNLEMGVLQRSQSIKSASRLCNRLHLQPVAKEHDGDECRDLPPDTQSVTLIVIINGVCPTALGLRCLNWNRCLARQFSSQS